MAERNGGKWGSQQSNLIWLNIRQNVTNSLFEKKIWELMNIKYARVKLKKLNQKQSSANYDMAANIIFEINHCFVIANKSS